MQIHLSFTRDFSFPRPWPFAILPGMPKRTIYFLLAIAAAGLLPGRAAPAAPVATVLHLAFESNLHDQSGRANDGFIDRPVYAAGQSGQALELAAEPLRVADRAELHLAPGLRIDCWVKFAAVPPAGAEIVAKNGEYLLRVDPASEGGRFAFFVNLDGLEPRVSTKVAPQPGVWYHLVAGWNGAALSLDVNGEVGARARAGTPSPSDAPVLLGPFRGLVDEVKIENPNFKQTGVAHWSFDGDLRDDTGHHHDLSSSAPRFVPGRLGQALGPGPQLTLPDTADLRLSPGLRIACWVYFDKLPTGYAPIVAKDGEYQLRVDSPKEGGVFSFFVNLGKWDPRVRSTVKAEPGKWYHLVASWDGTALKLDVNGEREELARSGPLNPGAQPLALGLATGRLDDLRIENPRLPMLRVRSLTQEQTLLQAGRPERLIALVENLGAPAANATAKLELPATVACLSSNLQTLGSLAAGETKSVEWTVRAGAAVSAHATVRLAAAGVKPPTATRTLAFFPERESPLAPVFAEGGSAPRHYIDSVNGNNASSGATPEAPWRDFANLNGKTLAPGERVLLKRGSVFNQELNLSAAGASNNWAQIDAYGAGPRPIIRRNWDIDDRCALVRNPSYLRIRSLVVCCAGKGLIVNYTEGGHRGLIIEDCLAHHIEGLYRFNAHGIPEWFNREGAPNDHLRSSAGFAATGVPASGLVLRDCEMFQCSWGFFFTGEAVTIDRVFVHDNYVHNTCPHPALVGVRRSYLQNSIFDAPGWHAFAGTMGIMLCDPEGLLIRNCAFRNQPDSGSHDEGGIDFENHGNGILIDHCTFENNAGAAIEVLGLKVPQPRNVEIARSRFIKNNTATKLGPSEIFIAGENYNPEVWCSTGSIHDNGYVTNAGIRFFTNQAPATTAWTLENNRAFDTPEQLRRAMPFNEAPVVNAGPDLHSSQRTVRLAGSVLDDGQPAGRTPTVRWEVLEGPGAVTFQNAAAPQTTADFAAPGDYLLRLVADDGELWRSALTTVHILPERTTVLAAWEFNRPRDKEGWTEANLGTKVQNFLDQKWPCKSEPVKYVAGGYYVLALDQSTHGQLLSPDQLGADLARARSVCLRFQNHTPATRMRLSFTTAADPAWDPRKSQAFDVTPNDTAPRVYAVDLSKAPGWTGRLKQLRLDFSDGAPVTGTCRIDYLRLSAISTANLPTTHE